MKKIKKIIVILLVLVLVAPILFYGVILVKFNSVKSDIYSACNRYNIDKNLVISIAYVESKFNKNAVSSSGAIGVMQIMPQTAEFIIKNNAIVGLNDLFDVKTNVEIGVLYLKYLFEKYSDEIIVIASYNAGEGNTQKWLENGTLNAEKIPFTETYNYVKKVMKIKGYLDRQKT